MLLVPCGQPPQAQWSSSTYQAHPAGPGLPRAEPSAAAMIVTAAHPSMVTTRIAARHLAHLGGPPDASRRHGYVRGHGGRRATAHATQLLRPYGAARGAAGGVRRAHGARGRQADRREARGGGAERGPAAYGGPALHGPRRAQGRGDEAR